MTDHRDKPRLSGVDMGARRDRAELLGHDIRNAVSDILGGLALADLRPLDTASRQQLIRVRSASEQLARLADEALALVNGDSPPPPDNQISICFEALLDAIEARWSAHAAERGMAFALHRGVDLPDSIGVEKGGLERILANIIGNAMKYAQQGTVSLHVKLEAQETLSFCVHDEGPGFSDNALARLFERNARSPENVQPGSGLGLHIVRDLTDQIRGQMTVGNLDQGGATVCIRLPRPAWAPGLPGQATSVELPDLTGKCVLVAEDNLTNQLLVRRMLETLGADCHIASDGQEALDLLGAHHFNMALVDIEMPRLSGLDLIRALRANETGDARLPVLAITAYVLSANRAEIYDAGADGILAKPIMSLESFGQAIAGVLQKHQIPPAPAAVGAPGDTLFSALHLDRLLALAGTDGGRELLSRLRQDFDAVRRGLESGLESGDFPLLRARTHVLISLAGAIGAEQLQERATAINTAAHGSDLDNARALGPGVVMDLKQLDALLSCEFNQRYGQNEGSPIT